MRIESAPPMAAQPLNSVLLVEHHDELRASLRDWLFASLLAPLKLVEARNREEALQHAEKSTHDLVLMNLELPGLSGIEVMRELRRLYPECPVVIMSMIDSEALRIAATEAGALAFVPKRELPGALLPILGRLGK